MRTTVSLVLVLTLAAAALADVVHVAGGRKIRGAVVSEDETEVVVNTYNSRHPGAVLGTERFPRSRVKRIDREVVPLHEYRRRAAAATSVRDHLDLAAYCEEHRLKVERERELLRAFAKAPEDEAVRKEISPSKAERLIRAGYDDREYTRPELAWTQSSYVQHFVMIHDRYLYDEPDS